MLLKHGRCVKGKQFLNYRDTGLPVTAAKIYDAQRVDELVFLDILASIEDRDLLLNIVTETAEQCFMPLTVGGGMRTIEDLKTAFNAGADKVCINSAAIENPAFITEASKFFGSANIVVSIDYKFGPCNKRQVYSHGGRKPTYLDPFDWSIEVERLGAGEIILTSIDREGTMSGYDCDFIGKVAGALDIPVIAHGGAGTLEHLKEVLLKSKVSGVAAASIFHFTDQSPIKARYYLRDAGLNVRL